MKGDYTMGFFELLDTVAKKQEMQNEIALRIDDLSELPVREIIALLEQEFSGVDIVEEMHMLARRSRSLRLLSELVFKDEPEPEQPDQPNVRSLASHRRNRRKAAAAHRVTPPDPEAA
jgi:hypothetical protein